GSEAFLPHRVLFGPGHLVYHTDKNDPEALQISGIWAIARDSTNQIWLGGRDGLARTKPDEEEKLRFQHWRHDPDEVNSLSYDFIEFLHVDPRNQLWIGTYAKGLDLIQKNPENPGQIRFVNYQNNLADPTSLPDNNVQAMFSDESGILWIATPKGLSKLDPYARHFERIAFQENEPYSLSDNSITYLFEDRRKNLWVGTQNAGVNLHKFDSEKSLGRDFLVYKNDRFQDGSLSHNQVSCIFEDDQGFIWIATYDGLNYLEPNQLDDPNGFRVLNRKDGLPHKWIQDIYQDDSGTYWLASYGGYVRMKFDPTRPDISPIIEEFKMDESNPKSLSNATTYKTEQDQFGHLWVGSFNGLNRLMINPQTDSVWFDCYYVERGATNSLVSNSINNLFRDSKGRLWALSQSGLHYVDIRSTDQRATFKVFNRKDGLPSANVVSMLEDDEGMLWVATNQGIAIFDPEIALDDQTDQIPVRKVFGPQDGLQGYQFNGKAAVKDHKGVLLFGGQNGFNLIDPKNIPGNPFAAPVVFTDFKLFNRSVNPGSADYEARSSPLKTSITYTDTVLLNYRQNDFSVEFAALSFTQSNQNQYAYKLEGFHRDWIQNGTSNQAAFTNLDNGRYRLLVRATNNDGVQSTQPAVLHIRILPPPWEQPWAYFLYLFLVFSGIFSFIRFRVKKRVEAVERQAVLERARMDERERIRKKNAADFHDELGHKLTKIGLFLGLAKRADRQDPQMDNFLTQTERYVKELSGGIRDFIWVLDPQKDSLMDTFSRLQDFGDQLFDYTDIRFKTNNEVKIYTSLKLDLDQRRQIVMIFKEAMNNTLKYSQATEAILDCRMLDQQLQLQLSDNGIGFDLEETSQKGYGLKNLQM
ncbi:MAG: two-component regulator propeller domain-containing protein, partial [Bacteroidota bacterium]